MYDIVADPYCYPGTDVLRNIPGHNSARKLASFEAVATARRFLEPMPPGRWSVRHYLAVHRQIFQDVYAWAGRLRTVRISKCGSMFCYPENIPGEMRRVFGDLRKAEYLRGCDSRAFAAGAAHFLAELNAIHPFRDGNGRAQMAFMALLAIKAGHPFDPKQLDPEAWLLGMVRSFHGDEQSLAELIQGLIA